MPHPPTPGLLRNVLSLYAIPASAFIEPFGGGLINHTWRVSDQKHEFILQQINRSVFTKPGYIADNIDAIALHLKANFPEYFFVKPLQTRDGQSLAEVDGEYYRLFPFVQGAITHQVVGHAEQAFEAASQFGRFTKKLADFRAESLHLTLPDFHNLSLRYQQFEEACANGDSERKTHSKGEIDFLKDHRNVVQTYERIMQLRSFKLRVTHHDTKISNVLFSKGGQGLCVIDLDTVMPGYFISDVGDMMRTYLSPVSEEEQDAGKVCIRDEFFRAIAAGYLQAMRTELTDEEIAHFVYGGKFMIYMQALRFLTDHLNNDRYYRVEYEGQNLVRAVNQIALLKQLLRKEDRLQQMVMEIAGI